MYVVVVVVRHLLLLLLLPLSCFLLRRLLQILTVQTERMMATMKKRMPPMRPAKFIMFQSRFADLFVCLFVYFDSA